MRLDRLSLVVLNLLAVARLLGMAGLTEAVAVMFLIRITLIIKEASFVGDRRPLLKVGPSDLPATRTYAGAKTR